MVQPSLGTVERKGSSRLHPLAKGQKETGKVRQAPPQGVHRDRDRNRQVQRLTVFRDTIRKKA